MPMYTPQSFIDGWKFELAHDFEKDGVPATWAPGNSGPKQWGAEDQKLDLPGRPTAMALSPDAALIAIAVNKEIMIYDGSTLALKKTLRWHAGHVSQLAFHPGGRFLLSGSRISRNQREEVVRLWDLEAAESVADWDMFLDKMVEYSVGELISQRSWTAAEAEAMSPSLTASLGELFRAAEIRRDVQRGDALEGRTAGFQSRPFSHDGKLFFYLTNRTEVRVYNIMERKQHLLLQGHTDAIMWVGCTPDDKIIASSAWDGTVKLWRSDTGALLHTLETDGHQLWAGRFSPDGKYLAVGSGSGKVFVWKMETAELLSKLEGGPHWVRTLDFTVGPNASDPVYLAAGAEYNVRVFDIHTAAQVQHWEVKSQEKPMMYEISDVQYSPSGFKPHALGIKAPDGRITIYDGERNVKWEFEQPLTDAPRFFGTGYMIFNPATTSIISADNDNALRVWNL
ncbi:WD40-repeat-containing domain protein [Lyophyllum atratum]|nr:WD40-repeat-containing domain protein [Lyophyllum atratum]